MIVCAVHGRSPTCWSASTCRERSRELRSTARSVVVDTFAATDTRAGRGAAEKELRCACRLEDTRVAATVGLLAEAPPRRMPRPKAILA